MSGAYASLNWIKLLYGAKRSSVGDSEFLMSQNKHNTLI